MSEKQFEEQLKKKFEDYEIPVTPNLWMNVAKGIGSKSPLITASYKWLIAGMIVGGGAIGIYFNYTYSAPSKTSLSSVDVPNNSSTLENRGEKNNVNSDSSVTAETLRETINHSSSNDHTKSSKQYDNSSIPTTESFIKIEKPNLNKENQIETSNFSTAKTHCVGAEVSFNSPSTPDDVSFLWNFGDPPTGPQNFNNRTWAPAHAFSGLGPFQIKLTYSHPVCGNRVVFDTIMIIGPGWVKFGGGRFHHCNQCQE
jgi:hypothetical protein